MNDVCPHINHYFTIDHVTEFFNSAFFRISDLYKNSKRNKDNNNYSVILSTLLILYIDFKIENIN
jgi:hypothetical protein